MPRKWRSEKYKTNQQHLGMDQIFRRFVVKDWKGVEFHYSKHNVLNKTLVHHLMYFHRNYQKHRNGACHDPMKQKSRIIEWCNKLKIT